MKKVLISLIFTLIFISCSNIQMKDYFQPLEKTYDGGFENAGYSISSRIENYKGNIFYIENTKDSATEVERVYIIKDDRVELLFTGEETHANLDKLNFENGEIVLKKPFEVGSKWESKGNKYEIISKNGDRLEVLKKFPSGVEKITVYEKR